MELSEPFELESLTKPKSKQLKNQLNLSSLLSRRKMVMKSEKVSNAIFTLKSIDLLDDQETQSTLQIKKDLSYLTIKKNKARSSLTISLNQSVESADISSNTIKIKVYYFHSSHYIELILPAEIKVNDLISKALVAYSNKFKSSLPYGLDTNGYIIWLACEDSCKPDTDLIVQRDLKVIKLGFSSLCLCEKPGYVNRKNFGDNEQLKRIEKKGQVFLKVYYKGNWANVLVKTSSRFRDLLPVLNKKFAINDKNLESYEVKAFIEEIGEYCEVDLDLMVRELRRNEIWLGHKEYLDNTMLK